ncbi:MAG: HAMP domain-containing histidine kinase [Planctomycetes bacterium]|nr:HAMP domain-containing histidine kinase [Planctomycetota bacterium]
MPPRIAVIRSQSKARRWGLSVFCQHGWDVNPTSPSSFAARGATVRVGNAGNARWLVRLRWVAIAGQLITIGTVVLIWNVSLPVGTLLGIIAFAALTNLLLQGGLSRSAPGDGERDPFQGHVVPGVTMALDLVLLTAMLYFSGGPTNPFSFFYFVNLALAAILLPSGWVWSLNAAAIVCYVGLSVIGYHSIPELEPVTAPGALAISEVQKQGMVVAFAACALVNGYFIARVARELERRETELRVAEQRRARSERLEALATLAAGAGHELASPLSTIAVIASDLTKHLEGANVPPSVIEDVGLIRSELTHCRSILDRMSGHAGQAVGEQVGPWSLEQIVREVADGLRRRDRLIVSGLDAVVATCVHVPLQGLAQALRGLVQNGMDAAPEKTVTLHVERNGDQVVFQIRDQGTGMDPETLRRAGEPFFTTKEPGQGMGLGLFLTRNVIERLDGRLEIRSILGQGTTAEVRLPAA